MRQYQYFWPRTPTGKRIVFAADEITDVEPTPMGAIVTTKTGCQFKVTSPKPDAVAFDHFQLKPEEPAP